ERANASWTTRRRLPPRHTMRRLAIYAAYILFDGLVVAIAYGLALVLRFDADVPGPYLARFVLLMPLLALLSVFVNSLFGMYWRGWRYAGFHDALALMQAVGVSTLLILVGDVALFGGERPFPVGVIPVAGMCVLAGMGVGRFRHRLVQEAVTAVTR